MQKIGKENELQAAVIFALERYFQDREQHFLHLAPYANQQGPGLRKFCADILGVVDSAEILLLELKVLDPVSGRLRRFDDAQYQANLMLEGLGIPVAYAYNATQSLAYYERGLAPTFRAIQTLLGVNRAEPSLLPGVVPNVQAHGSLLAWLQAADEARGFRTGGAEILGRILGEVNVWPDKLRNGVLALIYAVDSDQLIAMDRDDLRRVYQALSGPHAALGQAHTSILERILGEAGRVVASRFQPPSAHDDEEQDDQRPRGESPSLG